MRDAPLYGGILNRNPFTGVLPIGVSSLVYELDKEIRGDVVVDAKSRHIGDLREKGP